MYALSSAALHQPLQSEKRLKQLVEVVKGVTLRRTKAIIADQLPRKTDNVVFCQLQPLQYRCAQHADWVVAIMLASSVKRTSNTAQSAFNNICI